MRWDERSYPEFDGLAGLVAVLPLGAVEAHGPHLPTGTDVVIAEAMAREGVRRLRAEGVAAFVLPAIAYAPAPFADEFSGTLSIRPETLGAMVEDVAAALARRGVAVLALASSHFDPAQVSTLRDTVARIEASGAPRIVFPDLTRRSLAATLTDEFRSGACHAGCYETSILLAERPDLVDDAARAELGEVPVSLVDAARAGLPTFGAAGMAAAYCGAPAAASSDEGRQIVARLGEILATAVRAALG
ncbi:MAG: creatininase family protein [Thermoanaerobaculia bacterium]|jgi:creatinine amidohydrolase|nr:MAG: creatininase family protein [Thermoanaerobaculia bacterium]MBZ0101953.1 creatininase family protein [Thermoanaerobaculia bacterium]